jgi:hypothetical protein
MKRSAKSWMESEGVLLETLDMVFQRLTGVQCVYDNAIFTMVLVERLFAVFSKDWLDLRLATASTVHSGSRSSNR